MRLCHRLAATAVLMSLLSCAGLQRTNQDFDRTVHDGVHTPVPVSGAHGVLSREQARAIIDRLERRSGPGGLLQRHLAVEQALTRDNLVAGNSVSLLVNGPATYDAMFDAISQAKDNINVETYFLSDHRVGRLFADLLIAKRKEGVAVNVMYDSFGSRETSRSFIDRMAKAGICLTEYNPLGIAHLGTINHRDHRKLLIVDGRIAFVGGMNIRSLFAPGRARAHPDSSEARPRRDTDVEIRGPVVARFQKFFFEHWKSQHGPKPAARRYFPDIDPAGNYVVRAIAGTAREPISLIYVTLLSAINSAEKSIYITDAYFAPNRRFLQTLIAAARRGVDVEMVLPSHSDTRLVLEAGRSHYSALLRAGVKIYERKRYILHAKTIVIDDVWATVGSTNLDWRSFLHNDEANAVILGKGFADQMQALFARDRAHSRRITRRSWSRRSVWERIEESFAALWEWWL